MTNKYKYIYYTLWLVGALLWLYIGDIIYDYYDMRVRQTYEVGRFLLISSFIFIVDGLYFGTLIIFDRRFGVNKPLLLIISLPTFLLGVTPLINYFIVDIYFYLINEYISEAYLLRIFGLSLMLGIFSKHKENKNSNYIL